jgi:hypothetical protein
MSLVQGYSSSEDEHDGDTREDASQATTSFPPLPKIGSQKSKLGGKILPLLEELPEDPDTSDFDEDGEDEGEHSTSRNEVAPPHIENFANSEDYQSDLATLRKRRRQDDLDEDMITVVPAALSLSQGATIASEDTLGKAGFRITERVAVEAQNNRQSQDPSEEIVRDMIAKGEPEELRRASAQGLVYSEVNVSDIRSDALRFQQAGVTANLQKLKGVSGRHNQITHLAQAARRQRDDK